MLSIVGLSGTKYKVLDTDDNSVELADPQDILYLVAKGVGIQGCNLTENGLLTEVDNKCHKIYRADDGKYYCQSVTYTGRLSGRIQAGFEAKDARQAASSGASQEPAKSQATSTYGGVKPQETEIKIGSFPLKSKRLTLVGVNGDEYLAYSPITKSSKWLRARDILKFKATGGIVESCLYSGGGLRFPTMNGQQASGNVEYFEQVDILGEPIVDEFFVSNQLRVKHTDRRGHTSMLVVQRDDTGWYVDLPLQDYQYVAKVKMEELLAKSFIPCPEGATEVVFLDGDKYNIRLNNLGWRGVDGVIYSDEYYTSKYNLIRCYRSDGQIVGEYQSFQWAIAAGISTVEEIKECCLKRGVVVSGGVTYLWRLAQRDEYDYLNDKFGTPPVIKQLIRRYSDLGVLMGEYVDAKSAGAEVGLSEAEIIAACQSYKTGRLVAGSHWLFASDDDLYYKKPKDRIIHLPNTAVRQYTPLGKLMAEYDTINEAAHFADVNVASISRCCLRNSSCAKDSIWRYKKDDELFDLPLSGRVKLLHPSGVRQYTPDGNMIAEYSGLVEAYRKTGIDINLIYRDCGGRSGDLVNGEFIFRFVDKDELYKKSVVKRMDTICRKYNVNYLRLKGWNEKQTWRDLPETVDSDSASPFKGVPAELQKWYEGAYNRGVGENEVWLPSPLCNKRRKDGSWRYEISSHGRIRSTSWVGYNGEHYDSKILKLSEGRSAPTVQLYDPLGKHTYVRIDKLVAMAFVPNPNGYSRIIHKDGDVNNCRWDNLEWVEGEEEKPKSGKKSVRQYTVEGRLIGEFQSITEASQSVNCKPQSIIQCCTSKKYKCKGFFWRYVDDDDLFALSEQERKKVLAGYTK